MQKYKFHILLLVLLVFLRCNATKTWFTSKASKSLYDKQREQCTACADAALWARKNYSLSNTTKEVVNNCDTIFIIERIDEIDKSVYSLIWNEKRNVVISTCWGQNKSENIITYPNFSDPLRIISEKFDTVSINNSRTYLGAYRVFISRLIKNKIVNTHYFNDITPFSYFNTKDVCFEKK